MSDAEPVLDRPATLPSTPWPRFAIAFVLFVVLGPVVAALLGALLLAGFAVAGSDTQIGDAISSFLLVPNNPLALHLGPFWGLVPAAIAGGVIAWHEAWRGPVTGFSAALLGMLVGAFFYMVGEFAGWQAAVYGASFSAVISIFAVWLLSRVVRFLGRNDPLVRDDG